MILYGEHKQEINKTIDIFVQYISHINLSDYFDIFITDDICNDFKLFDHKCKTTTDIGGVTILPTRRNDIIHILINNSSFITGDAYTIILHELAHVYDFVQFASYYCNNKLYKIRKHKYYKSFILWSEFHVKQVDFMFPAMISYALQGLTETQITQEFAKDIETIYYNVCTQKYINKSDISIKDTMWYLGELYICNLYGNHIYSIPQDVINKCDFISYLYKILIDCPNFEEYLLVAKRLDEFLYHKKM